MPPRLGNSPPLRWAVAETTGDRVPIRRVVVLIVGVAALATACGSDADSADVQPFSEVQDSEFVFEADPTDPSRTIFRMTTTEPMICAIVWGATDEFGHFNNSLAMNGTGIIDHDVILPGTEPGATYRFQVQGSTADGTLYQSEIGSFTAAAAEPPSDTGESAQPDVGTNLATSATAVEVSSEFSEQWAGANAIDGDTATEWATADDGDEAFISIDLGSAQAVSGVEFVTRSMADGSAITDTYTVTVDGGEALGPFSAATLAQPGVAALEAEGSVFRFDIDSSTGGNVGAVEVRIFQAG